MGQPGQALVGEGSIQSGELGIAVRRQVHRVKRLIIQGVREGQCHGGYLIVPVIADVRRARHDTAAYLTYGVMVRRRAALDSVAPREGRVTITCISGDRSGANGRRYGAAEIEMHMKLGGQVSVDQQDGSDASTSIAAEHQVTRLD
jgi:hypothetical protein